MVKRIIILFTLLFFLLGTVRSLNASYDEFFKSEANPVYSGESFDSWDEIGIFQPSVLLENNTFKLWYGSYNGQTFRIGPIYNEPNRSSHNPFVLRDSDGKYILIYTSSVNGDNNFRIKYVTSNNETNFDPNTLYTIPLTNNWELGDMSSPLLWKEDGIYYLFYAGRNNSTWKLGLKYSSNLTDWTSCSNPMFDDVGDVSLLKNQCCIILI